ncbi:MAG: hypothetical protein H7Y30_09365 [Pyrinomonadaceae bacterium]|nr:hypothetical protein [Pyrinomonadaceae bacterium]
MSFLRRLLPFVIVFLALAVVWVWWNRPKKVDMAAYVPADSLVYLEANSLPDIASGFTQTEAWKALAPPAGIKSGLGEVGWLSRIAAWTGIGPADAVVFSRAQVAATVLGFEAADGGDALRVRPRHALVIETHTGASRTRAAIEKRVGEFARRAYGEPRVEQKEVDAVYWMTWTAAAGDRRIIAAVNGSVAILGNDEAAVRACLAVKRGERPSLAGNIEMAEMRRRVTGSDALAFGFISTQGAAKLFEVAAALYVGQISQDPQVQSLAANILPQMASKILGSVGWSARLTGGAIEDVYFISVKNDATARLRETLNTTLTSTLPTSELLPRDTYSVTRYTTRDPLSAWRGLNFSFSSQLDPVLALAVAPLLKAAIRPYGIEEPEQFFQSIGNGLVTARLQNENGSTVTIVEVRDEKSLREFALKKLGTNKPQSERVGEAEMLFSMDEERGAASFVNGRLLLGRKEIVRQCLVALQQGQTLASTGSFQQSVQAASADGLAHAVTFTNDEAPARTFILFIAAQRAARAQPVNEQALLQALSRLAYASSETQLVEGGIERRTRSSFGQLGVLATQFATNN